MKRTIIAIAVIMMLAGCSTVNPAFQTGKVDQYLTWAENYLIGAQALLPVFGTYVPNAQRVITNTLALVTLMKKSGEDYTTYLKLKTQLENNMSIIQDLGTMAGVNNT
jgi:hypothetical protein